MKSLLSVVRMAPADRVLFSDKGGGTTAGDIRATASMLAGQIPSGRPVYLYTKSAALFVCGLVAAALKKEKVFCPAHAQPGYLREIGVEDGVFVTDCDSEIPALKIMRQHGGQALNVENDLALTFFTSGTTSTPKPVLKSIAQLDLEGRKLGALWDGEAGEVHATVSHHHIYGMLFRIFWPILSEHISQEFAAETWEGLAHHLPSGATVVSSPAHLTRIPHGLDIAKPGLLFSSGAPLPAVAASAARAQLATLPIEVLGSTETGGIAWRQQDNGSEAWSPFSGVGINVSPAGELVVQSDVAGEEPVVTGDLVEIRNGKFCLSGRANRVAKIDGFRVSLSRVEERLLKLPGVVAAAATDLPQRKGALGAIVELDEDGQKKLSELGPFRLSRKLREDLTGDLDPRERPKHWLFAPIPEDRQGKRLLGVLRAKFLPQADEKMGEMLAASVDGDRAELSLRLPESLVWFQGHFPEKPILPGIAQTHMAAQWAECFWGFEPNNANVTQLKFRRILQPGNVVRLLLTREASGRLIFAYAFDGIVASEGRIGG
jgi:3-hydroxymyristoyl/3-hydroxydecanoyl-(acyl carrier protein) dehydratase